MKFTGIIYKITPYKEKDAIINIIKEDNISSLLVNRAFAQPSKHQDALHPISLCEFTTNEKNTKSLKDVRLLTNISKTHNSYYNNSLFLAIMELINKLIPEDEIYLLFNPLKTILELLENGFDAKSLFILFLSKILTIYGQSMNVKTCTLCGYKNDIIGASINDGGFICKSCFDNNNHIKLEKRELDILKFVFLATPKDYERFILTDKEINWCLSFIKNYFIRITNIEIKSFKLI